MIPRNLAKAKDDSKGKGADETMQDELQTADGNKSSQMKKIVNDQDGANEGTDGDNTHSWI